MGDLIVSKKGLCISDNEPVIAGVMLGDLINEKLVKFLGRGIKGKTVSIYITSFRNLSIYLSRVYDNVSTHDLNEGDLVKWKKYMIDNNFSDSSINTYINCIKSFYIWYSVEYGVNDISYGLKNIILDNEYRRDSLSSYELKSMVSWCNERINGYSDIVGKHKLLAIRDKAIVLILATTGVRQMVVENMRWRDIIVKSVVVDEDSGRKELRYWLRYTKKHHGIARSEVPLGTEAIEAIEMWREEVSSKYFNGVLDNSWYVFFGLSKKNEIGTGKEPNKIGNSTVRLLVTECMKGSGVYEKGSKTNHSIRHGVASRVLKSTGNKDLVRGLLGHSSIAMTNRYTSMVDKQMTYEAVNSLKVD